HTVGFQVGHHALAQDRVVVPVVQGARAAEEIDVAAAVFVVELRAARLVENDGKRPDVASDFRLHPVKDFQVHGFLLFFVHGVRPDAWTGGVNGPMRSNGSASCASGPNSAAPNRSVSSRAVPRWAANLENSLREALLPGPTVVSIQRIGHGVRRDSRPSSMSRPSPRPRARGSTATCQTNSVSSRPGGR